MNSFFADDMKAFRVLNHILTKAELGNIRKSLYGSFHDTLNCDRETSIKLSHAGESLLYIAEMMYPDRFEMNEDNTKLVGKNSYQYIQWVGIVKHRDGNTCQRCKSTKRLQAHHIEPSSTCPEKVVDIDNGITLCQSCHKEFHSRYGDSGRKSLNIFLKE